MIATHRASLLAALVLLSSPLAFAYDPNPECMKLSDEGYEHFSAREFEEAVKCFDKARKADPRSAVAQRMYAVCMGSLAGTTGEQKATWDQAIAEWEKVLTMPDADVQDKAFAYHDLGNCHLNIKKQPEKALKYYKAGLAVAPESGDLWAALAQMYCQQEKWQDALDCAQKAVKLGMKNDRGGKEYWDGLIEHLKEKAAAEPSSNFAGTISLPSLGGMATTADLTTLVVSVPSAAQLVYVDAAQGKEAKRISLDFQPGRLAVQGKTLFVAARGTPKLVGIELETGKVLKTIKLPQGLVELSCHRSKGLVYGLAVTGEVISVDPSTGKATTCQAKGSLIAVDQGKPGMVYVAATDAKGEKTTLRRYTASGSDLKLADTNDEVSVRGCCLDATPDGKRVAVAGTGGWRDKTEGVKPTAIAVFETDKLATMAGLLETNGSPRSLAFHPVLDLGIALSDKTIVQFSSKSLVHVKEWPAPSDAKSAEPRFLAFVDGGRKLACWEPGDAATNLDGALRFLPLQLSPEEETALQKGLAGKGR